MRTYRLPGPGPLDDLKLATEDMPTPGPNQLLVATRAAAVNRRDLLIITGRYPLPTRAGVIPLSDGAGEVVAVGDAVRRFAVGDRVTASYWPRWISGRLRPEVVDQLGCTVDGWLTEYALLDQAAAVAVPEHLTWAEAAALPCAGVSAWNALTRPGTLTAGQTVLVLGTGDVALFAAQLAKAMGCRVIATTSSAAKAERLRGIGVDDVVDYVATPEWSKEVRALTGGAGADLVVETQGPATFGQSLRAAATYAQICLLWVASPRPEVLTITEDDLMGSLATIRREFVGNRVELEALCQALAAHRIRPIVDRAFGFDDAIAAYRSYRDEDSFGKVVVEIDSTQPA
ncbi:NAD(P)-dependent alcohol dehydrogenase [Catenulispora sp. NF23]|uniref:NAD(P)-dependent alcohol dehydrogenase n=1 Tax=Catenulispora pinistramenti TaxID=2705254 RepID=A0ABS5KM01_9ACTN|nr:NAD(P)-dependent alcohol dehydrogenase [Catenulispora pinistramenti]MBS2536412.1 NAD(P)-dependent alcohol dehydrogenase [Catenulispora pinistramenti]MBS2547077.1 NAD(P)-dependent alcohol dehydrogenase [Catenulispora pinistramenti]